MTFSINLSVARYSYANLLILTLALSTPLTFAFAGSRAIDHAPIGVFGRKSGADGRNFLKRPLPVLCNELSNAGEALFRLV